MRKQKRRNGGKTLLSGAVVEHFLLAESQVKGKSYARANLIQWLLTFSYQDTSRFTKSDWHKLQWQALVFAYDAEKHSVMPMVQLPAREQLAEMQQWLLTVWSDLEKGKIVSAPLVGTVGNLALQSERILGFISTASVPWSAAFLFRVFNFLMSADAARRFRFCEECRHPFVATKRQAYCSSSCSQKHRTRLWRQQNPQRFRDQRRAAYEKKIRTMLGKRVKIMTRSSTK